MKTIGKIILAAMLSLFIFALASPSEAWRGRGGHHGYRGHHRHHGHRGHYTGKHHYGKKYHIKRSYRHYRHRRYGHRGHRYGIYFGYGHGRYSRYGARTYHRYPHRNRYFYRSHRVNRYYDRGYPDNYRNDAFANYIRADYSRGWMFLKTDRPAQALEVFSKLAQANPSEGAPKVGYALATAKLGNLDRGIRAMRRALKADPKSLHYVTVDEELRPQVEQLAEQYERVPQFSGRDPSGSFMLAALYYLLDDMDAAQQAIERNYDTSISSENLKNLIQEES